jgi:hypothetical protein
MRNNFFFEGVDLLQRKLGGCGGIADEEVEVLS